MKHSQPKWPELALEEFTEVITGGTPSTSKPEYWKGGDIPWLNSGELNKRVITHSDNFITKAGLANSAARMMPENTVLVALTGATTGVSALLKMRACANQSVTGILPSNRHHPHFLFHYIQSIRPKIVAESYGGAQKHISQRYVKKLKVPLPPLAEQERIVKLLDEADELRKLRAQADHRTAALLPALFHEMFCENGKQAYERVKLEQIAEVVSGVAKGRKFNGQQSVEVPYLRVANVQAGHLDLSEIKTIQALPEEVETLALRIGDVLLTEGGDFDKLGRGAMLERDLPNCIHQNHVFRVRVERSRVEPVFFAKFLLTAEARRYFLGCAKQTTNLASINMRQLRALPVPVPPVALQKEFAQRVTEIRELEAGQAASRQRLEALFQSLLYRAFQGEL